MHAQVEESCRPEEIAATCPFAGSGRIPSWGPGEHILPRPGSLTCTHVSRCLGAGPGLTSVPAFCLQTPNVRKVKVWGESGLPSSPRWGGTVAVSAPPATLRASGSPLTLLLLSPGLSGLTCDPTCPTGSAVISCLTASVAPRDQEPSLPWDQPRP